MLFERYEHKNGDKNNKGIHAARLISEGADSDAPLEVRRPYYGTALKEEVI